MKLVCPDCLGELVDAHDNCPACGFARPKTGWVTDPLTGLILGGRYRLEGRLGAGGMASVFRASRIGALGGHVAVKVLAPKFARTVVARRFEREAQVVARLTNPHVVRVYDFDSFAFPGSELNLYYIAMELVEGHTLGAVLQAQGKVNFLWGIDVLRQVARGLEEAHAQGVVHRDLKPSNIMLVTQRGATHVKILDFGIAALADREQVNQEKLTQTGFVSGTPDYMAPEQAVGDPHIGPAADIFALGIIAYELFSGRRPFAGATMESLLARVTKQAPSLREAITDPAFPPDLFRIVDKMLVREPERRYPHAGALLDELGRFPTLQTTPDFVPPAELLKRYATESQPAFRALSEDSTAEGGDGPPGQAFAPTVDALETRAARPAALVVKGVNGEKSDGVQRDYAPPEVAPKKGSSAWVWIAALLVLGGVGGALALVLGSGDGPAAPEVSGAAGQGREVSGTDTSPTTPVGGSSGVLGKARPPVAAGLVERRLPLGRELVAVALPIDAPPLSRPMGIELAFEVAGVPMVASKARLTTRRGELVLATSDHTGRPEDGRVGLTLPPLPLPDRYELDVSLELADGARHELRLSYDAARHEVRARP